MCIMQVGKKFKTNKIVVLIYWWFIIDQISLLRKNFWIVSLNKPHKLDRGSPSVLVFIDMAKTSSI